MATRTSNNIIARSSLLAYFVFAFVFMWAYYIGLTAILTGLLQVQMTALPDWLSALMTAIAAWTPSIAAAIVVGVCEGPGGVRRLFAMFFHFRLAARWYLAALIPAALALAAGAMYRVFGGAGYPAVNLSPGMWAFLFVTCLLSAATGEEPGWRGFALPRLLQRFSPLNASLVLSLVWSFWHLPVLLGRGLMGLDLLAYILAFFVFNFSLTSLMTWIFQRTSHSLVPMVLAHFTANFTPIFVVSGLGLGRDIPIFYITAGLSFITILVIRAAGGFRRQTPQAERQRFGGLDQQVRAAQKV